MKIFKKTSVMLAVLILMAAFASCKKDNNSSGGGDPEPGGNPFIGTWIADDDDEDILEVTETTWAIKHENVTVVEGTYACNEKTATLKITDVIDENIGLEVGTEGVATVSGNEMTISGFGDKNIVYTKQSGEVPTVAPFEIKQATIKYEMLGLMYYTMTFDKYGKLVCIEQGSKTFIIDEIANKSYQLDVKNKTYQEITMEVGKGKRKQYIMFLNDENYEKYGYTKSYEEIAGKSCTVYSNVDDDWGPYSYGGWKKIIFLETMGGESDVMRATSFNEAIDTEKFKIPSDYTKN
jgi:hypothetical protein